METKRKLREELENAETRSLTHFRKLQEIERILRKSELDKTPTVFVVEKIKEVIVSQNK